MSDYIPVPVDVARRVATEFHKAIVVIVSWDAEHDQLHTTTYGDRPALKSFAAELGEWFSVVAGGDLSRMRSFEDFRHRSEAEAAAEIERLMKRVAELEARPLTPPGPPDPPRSACARCGHAYADHYRGSGNCCVLNCPCGYYRNPEVA